MTTFRRQLLSPYSTMKTQAAVSSETTIIRYETAWCHNLEYCNLNLKLTLKSKFSPVATPGSRGGRGTFEQGALLNKLNILPSDESICRYFCNSRVVPLLRSYIYRFYQTLQSTSIWTSPIAATIVTNIKLNVILPSPSLSSNWPFSSTGLHDFHM